MPGSTLTNLRMNLVVLAAIMSNLACYRWGNRGRERYSHLPGILLCMAKEQSLE